MFIFHNGGVQILCKYPDTVRQFKMQLLKGNNVLCDLTKIKGSEDTESIRNLNACKFQLSNNSVSFFLYNLDSSYANYYICKLSIFDPPPFQVDILSREYLNIYGKILFSSSKLEYICILTFLSLMKTVKQTSII